MDYLIAVLLVVLCVICYKVFLLLRSISESVDFAVYKNPTG